MHVLTRQIKHCVRTQQYDTEALARLFDLADQYRLRGGNNELKGKIVVTWFEEESTRTRFSFEAATLRLGGSVLSSADAAHFSSVAKGESLEDTMRVLGCYADAIVLRHSDEDAADRAAAISNVPIINAGCGPHKDKPERAYLAQHPTQALLDAYTIWQKFMGIDDLTVLFVGDLRYGRTVRSLAYLLSKYKNVRIMFAAPQAFAISDDIKEYLTQRGVEYKEYTALTPELVRQADVVYMTRIQKERFPRTSGLDTVRLMTQCTLSPLLAKNLQGHTIVMHPLPRNSELPVEIDALPQAWYLKQAQNALYVRMALLAQIFE